MCLILMAYKMSPHYPFIFAANRDEFYDRPSQTADFWPEHPRILAGRDLRGGGTWLGITREGRFAALTNYRDPSSLKSNAPSRGALVSRFLAGTEGPVSYLSYLAANGNRYNGFNIIFGYTDNLYYYCARREEGGPLEPGIHGLSNAFLNTPWPKVQRGKEKIVPLVKRKRFREEPLFAILADRSKPPEGLLPRTGVDREWERVLSSIFIASPVYGTRSSTIIVVDRRGETWFEERSFNGLEPWISVKFKFALEDARHEPARVS